MFAPNRFGRVVAGILLSLLPVTIATAQTPTAPTRPASTRPAPRWPDGTINFGAPPGETGKWEGEEPLVTDPHNYETVLGRRPRPGRVHIDAVPLQPWARALIEMRNARFLADEPYTRCHPSPGPRSFGTAYGVELLNLPGSDRVYLFMTGGSHSYRVIYMDGRTHPHRLDASDFGHSIGWWDGDTLVIDTVGFNESAWMERWGVPHTSQLHTLERVTRVDYDTLNYEITIDDPGAYTAAWTSGYIKRWENGTDLFEYVCQENNYAPEMMIGVEDGGRRGPVVFVP